MDRDADVWEPLVAVADMIGGSWPDEPGELRSDARGGGRQDAEPSLGIRLLTDIKRYSARARR